MSPRISNHDTLLDLACESPEMAPFAWFNIDLSMAVNPDGSPMFPQLVGSKNPVWLWNIRSNGGNEVDHKREDGQAAEVAHRQRVLLYSLRVKHNRPIFGVEDDTPEVAVPEPAAAPQDEWTRFWCGESPTQRQAHYRGAE